MADPTRSPSDDQDPITGPPEPTVRPSQSIAANVIGNDQRGSNSPPPITPNRPTDFSAFNEAVQRYSADTGARTDGHPAQESMTGATPVSPNPVSQPPVATAIGNPFSRPLVSPPNSPDAPGEISVATEIPVATLRTPKDPTEPIGIRRRVFRFIGWSIRGLFCIASLIALLAVLSAIPIFQLIAFGYLLDVAGRLTRGAKFRDSLPNLQRAGTIGLAATAIFVASLPTQLLVHWESVAQLIDPGSLQATLLRVLAFACSFAAMGYLLWAWVRGGQLRHYLWPQPKRFLREGWRPGTWSTIPDRLWDFTVALELPRLFWLGTRGAVATLIWLVPGMIIIAMNRNGETPVAGLIGGLALIAMGGVLLYLPMLQAHFAAENRLGAMFELRRIRQDFRRAPWAWLLAMIFGLVILPIPLYLLKIEATPREVLWLPCVVFVGFILPARVGEGLALRRARRRPDPSGLWAGISIWSVRVLMLAVVGTYLIFLTVSQFTSWDGLPTWVEQHAILFPRPFIGGV